MTRIPAVGSRAQVWHGTAKHTSGGLTRKDLMKNKHGRIVSRRKHATAKRERRLVKAGFLTKKGHFGAVRVDRGTRRSSARSRSHSRSRSMRGGGGVYGGDMSPASFP